MAGVLGFDFNHRSNGVDPARADNAAGYQAGKTWDAAGTFLLDDLERQMKQKAVEEAKIRAEGRMAAADKAKTEDERAYALSEEERKRGILSDMSTPEGEKFALEKKKLKSEINKNNRTSGKGSTEWTEAEKNRYKGYNKEIARLHEGLQAMEPGSKQYEDTMALLNETNMRKMKMDDPNRYLEILQGLDKESPTTDTTSSPTTVSKKKVKPSAIEAAVKESTTSLRDLERKGKKGTQYLPELRSRIAELKRRLSPEAPTQKPAVYRQWQKELSVLQDIVDSKFK